MIWATPLLNSLDANRVGSQERGLALPLASAKPVHQARHRGRPDREEQRDGLAALLPHEDPDDEATMPITERNAPVTSIDRSPV